MGKGRCEQLEQLEQNSSWQCVTGKQVAAVLVQIGLLKLEIMFLNNCEGFLICGKFGTAHSSLWILFGNGHYIAYIYLLLQQITTVDLLQ